MYICENHQWKLLDRAIECVPDREGSERKVKYQEEEDQCQEMVCGPNYLWVKSDKAPDQNSCKLNADHEFVIGDCRNGVVDCSSGELKVCGVGIWKTVDSTLARCSCDPEEYKCHEIGEKNIGYICDQESRLLMPCENNVRCDGAQCFECRNGQISMDRKQKCSKGKWVDCPGGLC